MKPGDLRRFKDDVGDAYGSPMTRITGRLLMVQEVFQSSGSSPTVTILIDGRLEAGWGYQWVKDNTEALNEN